MDFQIISKYEDFVRELYKAGFCMGSATTSLQQKMYVTNCGEKQPRSKLGPPFGRLVTILCPVEDFFGEEILRELVKNGFIGLRSVV